MIKCASLLLTGAMVLGAATFVGCKDKDSGTPAGTANSANTTNSDAQKLANEAEKTQNAAAAATQSATTQGNPLVKDATDSANTAAQKVKSDAADLLNKAQNAKDTANQAKQDNNANK